MGFSVTATCELVWIKSFCSIRLPIPDLHDVARAADQGWCPGPATSSETDWTAGLVVSPVADVGDPFVAVGTHPMCRVVAADCVVMGRLDVFGCVPLLDEVWGLFGKGVVGAHSYT